MALAAETGELLEILQWKTTDEVRSEPSRENRRASAEEFTDVLIYVVRLLECSTNMVPLTTGPSRELGEGYRVRPARFAWNGDVIETRLVWLSTTHSCVIVASCPVTSAHVRQIGAHIRRQWA